MPDKNHAAAVRRAKANANRDGCPRYVHLASNGQWYVEKNRPQNVPIEGIDTVLADEMEGGSPEAESAFE